MTRWLAPLVAAVGLLGLLVGFLWAEWFDRMIGVRFVLWGAIGLVLAAAVAGLHEYAAASRRGPSRPRTPGR